MAGLFNGNGRVSTNNRRLKGSGAISAENSSDNGLVVHALRLVENTDRFSSDMRALERGAFAVANTLRLVCLCLCVCVLCSSLALVGFARRRALCARVDES